MSNQAYQCSICFQWYVREQNISCCVIHGPGQCCHYGERLATLDEVDEMLRVWQNGVPDFSTGQILGRSCAGNQKMTDLDITFDRERRTVTVSYPPTLCGFVQAYFVGVGGLVMLLAELVSEWLFKQGRDTDDRRPE